MKLLSLIVPVLDEEEAIPLFYEAVQEVLRDEPYELRSCSSMMAVRTGLWRSSKGSMPGIRGSAASPSRAISARSWLCPRGCRRPAGMLSCPWMWICRIRRLC